MAPHRPHGASIFCLAANGDETCIAFGGKHPYVNVVRTSYAFQPTSHEAPHLGGRCVVCELHPHEGILAALGLGGELKLLDSVTGAALREPFTGYGASYPPY
jgi:hypothetical protein